MKLKIGQLVSTLHSTSRTSNKAIYSHVAWLSDGLVDMGHDVNLFASACSETAGKLRTLPGELGGVHQEDDRLATLAHISNCFAVARKERFDLVHSHFNLLGSFFSPLSDIPTIVSMHSPVEERLRPYLNMYRDNHYVSFSLAQRKQMPELNWYANIYHGVDTDLFTYSPEPEDYLLFLGRITEKKGVHHAIEAAKKAGMKLRIAGTSYAAEGYWQRLIEPEVDGNRIRYFGEASFRRKIDLFRGARALLFPTEYDEVFGYSMIEAMSCGTPVIGFGNGSVPEIIQHGETGFVVSNAEEMSKAIKELGEIDRAAVRRRAERFFSKEKMVRGYDRVYHRILAERASQK